ncbi:hypothetical protein K440DRAFT_658313 [Wilcoxina mikolae CBS 423.85]|nr:hypothetical protein K440DRAFT_658313 [Wilcoxina mikolae CBS 423.85]
MTFRGKSTVFRIKGIPIGDEAVRVLRSEIEYPSLEDDEYISTLKAALAASGEAPPFNEQTEDRLATAIVKAAVQPELSADERKSLRVCIEVIPSCYSDNKRCALLHFSWLGKRRPLNDDRAPPIPKSVLDNSGKQREEFQLSVDDVILNVDRHFYGMTQLIIAVTGLAGHACFRTMIYGYNSRFDARSIDTFMDYGRGFLEEIREIRRADESLVKSVHLKNEDPILRATVALMFFVTPYRGLVVSDMRAMMQEDHSRQELLDQIDRKSHLLKSQLADFRNILDDRKVFSFYEMQQIGRLEQIRRHYLRRDLPIEWPGEEIIRELVRRADGLFIYAATICRFIGEKDNDPEERLSFVLQEQMNDGLPTKQLDSMYETLLRRVVGTIVILADTITTQALAKLLFTTKWEVEETLDSFRAVLDISPSSHIRLLHTSFRDFLLGSRRSSDHRFRIDREQAHKDLLVGGFQIMSHLTADICGLRLPGTLMSEDTDMKLNVTYLKRFTLSLMEKISEGVVMTKAFHSLLTVYSSALMFSPSRSIIRNQFWTYVPGWIEHTPAVPKDWSAVLQILDGHSDSVHALAFSPNGKLLASGSNDKTVRLWDSTTGASCMTLVDHSSEVRTGHSDEVRAVAFSTDGKLLTSASYDGTVRLWDVTTGALRGTLRGYSGGVAAVTFSPDGKLLASSSYDETIKL